MLTKGYKLTGKITETFEIAIHAVDERDAKRRLDAMGDDDIRDYSTYVQRNVNVEIDEIRPAVHSFRVKGTIAFPFSIEVTAENADEAKSAVEEMTRREIQCDGEVQDESINVTSTGAV